MASELSQPRNTGKEEPSRGTRRRRIMRAFLRTPAGDVRAPFFHFEQEMMDLFAKNRMSSSIVVPVLVIVTSLAVGFIVDPVIALVWGSVALALHGLAIRMCRIFLHEGTRKRSLAAWKRRFIACDVLYGLCWGVFPLVFLLSDFDRASLDIIRFATIIIVLSVGALLSSPIPAAAVAGTLPIALSMAAVHMVAPTFFDAMVSMCTLSAEIFFLYLASHLYEQHARNLATRAEKDCLFAELEQAKAVSDEARRRAEAANKAKSQFLATMSHELRTPLNAILGFSEVMCNEMLGPVDNSSYKDYLKDIHSSGQHLLKLINEILDLSRIEAGKRELREELTSLAGIAEEARGLLDLKARQKNIAIAEAYDEELPKIILDEGAIRQVALNLLSNALKFTPRGGEIIVKVGRTQAGGQYISVRDNGPGIPEAEIPVVLSAFGQGSVSLKTDEQGTGLGIPIVQALLHLHGGNFTLRSKVGVGTEAIATFPPNRVVSAFTKDDRVWRAMQAKKPKLLKKAAA